MESAAERAGMTAAAWCPCKQGWQNAWQQVPGNAMPPAWCSSKPALQAAGGQAIGSIAGMLSQVQHEEQLLHQAQGYMLQAAQHGAGCIATQACWCICDQGQVHRRWGCCGQRDVS